MFITLPPITQTLLEASSVAWIQVLNSSMVLCFYTAIRVTLLKPKSYHITPLLSAFPVPGPDLQAPPSTSAPRPASLSLTCRGKPTLRPSVLCNHSDYNAPPGKPVLPSASFHCHFKQRLRLIPLDPVILGSLFFLLAFITWHVIYLCFVGTMASPVLGAIES